jgi:glycosyltransferase involved in cell wall biosynthesis
MLEKSALIICNDSISKTFDRRIINQADLLVEKGWKVVIVAEDPNTKEIIPANFFNHEFVLIPRNRTKKIIEIIANLKMPKYLHSALRGIYTLGKKARGIKVSSRSNQNTYTFTENFDASELHFSEPINLIIACDITSYLTASRIASETGARIWLDLHEYYSTIEGLTSYWSGYYKCLEELALRQVHRCYTVNPMLANRIMQDYPDARVKIEWLPNSLPLRNDIKNEDLRSRLSLSPNTKILLFHGWIHSYRNIEKMIELAKELGDTEIHVLLLGYGNPNNFITGESPKNLHYMEAVPMDELPNYLAAVNAIIAPYPGESINSRYSFPNKFGDAIEMSIPVIYNYKLEFVDSVCKQFQIGIPVDIQDSSTAARNIKDFFLSKKNSNYEGAKESYGQAFFIQNFYNWLDEDFNI